MEWVIELLRGTLGKKGFIVVTGVILGVLSTILIPKYVITTEFFNEEKAKLQMEIAEGDNWLKLDMLDRDINRLKKQIWQLETIIEQTGGTPTQIQRLREMKDELSKLKRKEVEILRSIKRKR
jgi:hypothetical protein